MSNGDNEKVVSISSVEKREVSNSINSVLDRLDEHGEVLLVPDFVCAVGSSVTKNSTEPSDSDLDILFRQTDIDESLILAFHKAIGRDLEFHAIFNPRGPHSDYIGLFDLVLKKKSEFVYKILKQKELQEEPGRKPTDPTSGLTIKEGMTGQFVMQTHKRGQSEHTDLRLHPTSPKKYEHLEGVTLNTPGSIGERNKALNPEGNEKILVEFKKPQPLAWLRFEGETKPGEVGATTNYPGVFKIVDKGSWRAGVQEPHFKEFEFEGNRFKGRWILTFAPLPRGGEQVRVWLLSKPEDQVLNADKEKEETIEKQKGEVSIVKIDEYRRLVTGEVLVPDEYDSQGDIYDERTIEDAAHEFLAKYRQGSATLGFMHQQLDVPIELVESFIAPIAFNIEEKKIKKGTWLITVKILNDAIWNHILDGNLTSFSVAGKALARPVI